MNMARPRNKPAFDDASMTAFRATMDGTTSPDDKRREAVNAMAETYRACFNTPAGRAVLEDMRLRYVHVTRFVPGSGAEAGFFREGMAAVYFDIEDKLEINKEG